MGGNIGVEGDRLPRNEENGIEEKDLTPVEPQEKKPEHKPQPVPPNEPNQTSFASGPIYAIEDLPGHFHNDKTPASTLPKWYMKSKEIDNSLGSQPILNNDHDHDPSSIIPEKFYGQWFHNAAIVIVSSLITYILSLFNFGVGPLFIVLVFSVGYYNISMTKVENEVHEGISKQLMKPPLESEAESADWVNNFLKNFWYHLEPYICEQVIANVEPIAHEKKPGFIKSIKLSHLTLGSKAPRILSVRTWPSTADNIITMDWRVAFTPGNIGRFGEGQNEGMVNPKVKTDILVGFGKYFKSIPIILQDMSFYGHMRVKLTLINDFPHVKLVDLSFIEKPYFDYIAKPIGGESFGVDVNYIPGLTSFIQGQVDTILGPMMYDPNVFTLNLQEILAGGALDSASGVLQLTVRQARGLKTTKVGGGSPDPYTTISLGNSKVIEKTKTIQNTNNPYWMETKFLLVNSLNEQLILNVFDYNDHRKDSEIGLATINLQSLDSEPVQEHIGSKLLTSGKERGEIRYDLTYFPCLEAKKDEDGQLEQLPDLPTGVVRLYVHEALDLDSTKSKVGRINPQAHVYLKGKEVLTTQAIRGTKSPLWDTHAEFLTTNKDKTKLQLKIYHHHNFKASLSLGNVNVNLADLLECEEKGGKWFDMSHSPGKVRLSASFKPVNMEGALDGIGEYSPPIGLLKVFAKNANDVKNVEAGFGGKSDPYVKALLGGKVYGKTNVIDSNLNPVWNEHMYIPIHSTRDMIWLEVLDYQNLTKDRPLGHTTLKVKELLKDGDDKNLPYIATGVTHRNAPLKLDKGGYKGELEFDAEFIPAWKVKGSAFDEEKEKEREEERQKEKEEKEKEKAEKKEKGEEIENEGEEEEEEEEGQGIELNEDELLDRESGVLLVRVESGELAHKNSRLEFLLDDASWPTFSTDRSRSKNTTWNFIGEGLIRELSFSQLRIRLNKSENEDNEDIYAETSMDTREFLYRSLNKDSEFTLSDEEGNNESKIKLTARYLPVEMNVTLRESVNNQGNLRVDIISAKGLASADRNGKSDPYSVFNLNGDKVYKTETKKKTLNPEWNEWFETPIGNRVDDELLIEVFDWDRMSAADLLGIAKIDLTKLEPLESKEMVLDLKEGESGDQGQVTVNFLFKPSFIVKSRSRTSTFSTAGRALTQVGGIGLGAGKGVVHGAGHIGKGAISGVGFVGHNVGTVGRGVGGIFGIGKKKSPSMSGNESFIDESSVDNSQLMNPNLNPNIKASKVELGNLIVNVVKAKDLKGEGHHDIPKVSKTLISYDNWSY